LAWTLEYAGRAKKQLRKLDRMVARRIADFLDERVATNEDPRRIGKALKGPLGERWCYRVGDYRIICDLDDGVMRILVLEVGNRREVYR
jgi:mRNA interferase RelE/StbE